MYNFNFTAMSKIYREFRLKTIPEFRMEVEQEPLFRLLTGPAKASWYYKSEFMGHTLVDDVKKYSDSMREFFHWIDQELYITTSMYRNMSDLLKNGKANQFFKEIYNTNVSIFCGFMICFKGQFEIRFWDTSYQYDRKYTFEFKSSYSHRPSYIQEYSVSEGMALSNLLHLYFLCKIKEMPLHRKQILVNYISDSYIRADILKLSIKYGFLKINTCDGSLEAISDIL